MASLNPPVMSHLKFLVTITAFCSRPACPSGFCDFIFIQNGPWFT